MSSTQWKRENSAYLTGKHAQRVERVARAQTEGAPEVMEGLCSALECQPGMTFGKLTRGAGVGTVGERQVALRQLIKRGYIRVEKVGPEVRHRHHLVRPYVAEEVA